MKKVLISLGLLAASLLHVKAQKTEDTSDFKKRKLKFEEANLVGSYYTQSGDRSAVTGGIGTEALQDYAASFDLRLSKYDRKGRQHSFVADFNIDYYSSASSDQIDPNTVSSASMTDTHIYPSVSWNVKNDNTKTTKGITLSYSTEWDYKSKGISVNYAKSFDNDNRELSIRGGAFFDTWMAILPVELRPEGYSSGANGDQDNIDFKARNSYNLAISLSQVINRRLQLLAIIEPSYQEGLLSTPYHRTYFTNGNVTVERLPGQRFKLPMGLRASYFAGDNLILRTFYRYYLDTWGMTAHTANLEGVYKFTPFLSVSPFYRVSFQNAVRYFAPYAQHNPAAAFYTSDYDISGFTSNFLGSGVRVAPPGGIFGINYFNAAELRYGYYARIGQGSGLMNPNLVSHIITLQLKVK